MFDIHETEYGYHLIYSGIMTTSEAEEWLAELEDHIRERINSPYSSDFFTFHDMINLKPPSHKVYDILSKGKYTLRIAGLKRSVVILSDPIVTLQHEQNARDNGDYEWERYIDTACEANWKSAGMEWLLHGIEPKKHKQVLGEGSMILY